MKCCRTCQIQKPLSAFTPSKQRADGVVSECKKCAAKRRRDYVSKNKGAVYASNKQSSEKNGFAWRERMRWKRQIAAARKRAEHLGVAFDLTAEWLARAAASGVCEATGEPFDLSYGKVSAWSPTIDRIQQDGDYTMRNCRVTSWIFNRARGSFSDKDLLRMSRAIVEKENAERELCISRRSVYSEIGSGASRGH